MKSLMYLEAALLEGKTEEVSDYFAEIDQHTANDHMEKAGLQFGFKTLEVNGMVVAKMEEAARILGYKEVWGLSKLLGTYQIMTYKIGWFLPEVETKIRKHFNLSPKDGRATFITWSGFLVAGMYGQNEEAKKIKVYLLKMETVGRVALAVNSKFELAEKNYELKRLETSIRLAIKLSEMKEGPYKNIATADYEQLTGRKLPESPQQKIFDRTKSK